MFKRTLAATLIFGAAALAPPALAQATACLPRDKLVDSLSDKFSESLAGAGYKAPSS